MTLKALRTQLAEVKHLRYRSGDGEEVTMEKTNAAIAWITANGIASRYEVVYTARATLDALDAKVPAGWTLLGKLVWSDDFEAYTCKAEWCGDLSPERAWAVYEGCPLYEWAWDVYEGDLSPERDWAVYEGTETVRFSDEGTFTLRVRPLV